MTGASTADIGIVIVTWNSGEEIGSCLDAAKRTGANIIVVDNASSDDTVAQVRSRSVRLIANRENRGFPAAVNQGIAALGEPFILLLNPDAVLLTSLQPLREKCMEAGTGGAGGRMLDAGGRPQRGFMVRRLPSAAALAFEALLLNRLWPRNPGNQRYRCLDRDDNVPGPVEQPAGAFFMIRRDLWLQLGGFDEGFYPLWFEDVDFCRRAADIGLLLHFVPEAVVKHTGGHSISKILLGKREFYWYGNLLRYAAKHFGAPGRMLVASAVMFGSLMRMTLGMVAGRSFQPLVVYGKVLRLAVRYLFGQPV